MDVAISGASGLIGSALSASLRADGHRVLRLVRGGVTDGDAIGWDPDAGRIDAPALEGLDAVVHLAGEGIGEHRWTDEQKAKIRDSRMRGTALLAGAIASRERKPRVFVSGSAIGYYGSRGDEVLTEESAPGDDFLAWVCVAWEAEAAPATEAGVRTVFTRTGIVLDAHGGALARMLLPFKLGLGGKQGSGQQWMSWIAKADEVGAIRHAVENRGVEGPVNCTAPDSGHQRRLRPDSREGAEPADGLAHAAPAVEAALRRRAGRDVAARQPARRTHEAGSDRLRIRVSFTRRGARRDPARRRAP